MLPGISPRFMPAGATACEEEVIGTFTIDEPEGSLQWFATISTKDLNPWKHVVKEALRASVCTLVTR